MVVWHLHWLLHYPKCNHDHCDYTPLVLEIFFPHLFSPNKPKPKSPLSRHLLVSTRILVPTYQKLKSSPMFNQWTQKADHSVPLMELPAISFNLYENLSETWRNLTLHNAYSNQWVVWTRQGRAGQ